MRFGFKRSIEDQLREGRPVPSEEFVRAQAGRIGRTGRLNLKRQLFEIGSAAAATAVVAAALLAFVGVPNMHLVPKGHDQFRGANVEYAAPTLTCTLTEADSAGHLSVSGTTTLNTGTISVTFSASPAQSPDFPQTQGATVTGLTWGPIKSTGGAKVASGHTYTATVTQTASGYANGSTTCTYVKA
jgi:hypothetical protein